MPFKLIGAEVRETIFSSTTSLTGDINSTCNERDLNWTHRLKPRDIFDLSSVPVPMPFSQFVDCSQARDRTVEIEAYKQHR